MTTLCSALDVTLWALYPGVATRKAITDPIAHGAVNVDDQIVTKLEGAPLFRGVGGGKHTHDVTHL